MNFVPSVIFKKVKHKKNYFIFTGSLGLTDTSRHQNFLHDANKGQRPLSGDLSNAILASDVIVGKPMTHLELQSSGGGQNHHQEIRIIGSNCFYVSNNLGIELIGMYAKK